MRIVDLGVTRYDWIPETEAGVFADFRAPKVSELTVASAVNLSPYVVTTTSVGATTSDTVSEKGITDVANVVTPTVGNYEGSLVLFRDGDDTGALSEDDLLGTFAGRPLGWLIKRDGLAYDAGYVAAQKIQLFLFMADHPQLTGGGGDGYLKMTVPLLQQGKFEVNATVAASS